MESTCFGSNVKVSLKQKCKSTTEEEEEERTISSGENGCFDCNICLESANDLVVTLCGHLYCWPCIYKWLNVQNSSVEPDKQPTCPVCKAVISHTSLVPLYGRGKSDSETGSNKLQVGLVIPHRPPPYNLNRPSNLPHGEQQLHPNYFHTQSRPIHYHQHYIPHLYEGYGGNGLPYHGGAASFVNPVIGMFGDMVLTRVFGVSDANLVTYSHNGSTSPRMRRQEMQIDKSLNRVSIFLLCCFILCLLLF